MTLSLSLSPQHLVEYALNRRTSPDLIAIAEVTSAVNLRWANSSTTTNGCIDAYRLTVIAIDGDRAVSVSGEATSRADVEHLLDQTKRELDSAPPADDALPLPSGRVDDTWDNAPEQTSAAIFTPLLDPLRKAFLDRRHLHYGFASHDVVTTYLGTSSGVRRHHTQVTGHYGITARSRDQQANSWTGGATTDFSIDMESDLETLRQRLNWARIRIDLPPGRYDTVLPPSAVADLMIDAFSSASARQAHEGQSVYASSDGIRWDRLIARPGTTLYFRSELTFLSRPSL